MAGLTEAEQKRYDWGFDKYGWTYIWRDGIKIDKDGNPVPAQEPKYTDDSNVIEHDPVTDKDADEVGFKDPDYVAPDTADEGDLTQAEEDFLMNDDNFDTGGNLNEYNAQGEYIGDFEIGTNWVQRPPKEAASSKSAISHYASMNPSAKQGALRRNIREKKSLITGSK